MEVLIPNETGNNWLAFDGKKFSYRNYDLGCSGIRQTLKIGDVIYILHGDQYGGVELINFDLTTRQSKKIVFIKMNKDSSVDLLDWKGELVVVIGDVNEYKVYTWKAGKLKELCRFKHKYSCKRLIKDDVIYSVGNVVKTIDLTTFIIVKRKFMYAIPDKAYRRILPETVILSENKLFAIAHHTWGRIMSFDEQELVTLDLISGKVTAEICLVKRECRLVVWNGEPFVLGEEVKDKSGAGDEKWLTPLDFGDLEDTKILVEGDDLYLISSKGCVIYNFKTRRKTYINISPWMFSA